MLLSPNQFACVPTFTANRVYFFPGARIDNWIRGSIISTQWPSLIRGMQSEKGGWEGKLCLIENRCGLLNKSHKTQPFGSSKGKLKLTHSGNDFNIYVSERETTRCKFQMQRAMWDTSLRYHVTPFSLPRFAFRHLPFGSFSSLFWGKNMQNQLWCFSLFSTGANFSVFFLENNKDFYKKIAVRTVWPIFFSFGLVTWNISCLKS